MDQRLDQAVQVLRVGGVVADRHAEHARLGAQARDRVDLAVVAEHRERLHAHERRPRVGRVAVVAEQRDGLAARVGEVVEVALEHQRRAHHLVDAALGRQRGDVRVERRSRSRSRRRTGCGRAPSASGHQHADLPEVRLLLARGRARARSCRPGPRARPARAGRRGAGSGGRRCLTCSKSAARDTNMCATANAGSSASRGAWPPWRTSSCQIRRGMSIITPQPSPSPSTLPARCSIF